jgi:hypothetical protein
MKAILTIFQHPVQELDVENRSASKELARTKRTEPVAPSPPLPTADNAPPGVAELIALQKLLADIEARAITRVQPPYLMQLLAPSRSTRSVRTLVGLLWVMSLVLCGLLVKYLDHDPLAAAIDPTQTRSISNLTATVGDQNKQFSRMADSIEALANAVATSSIRTTAMQAVLRRLGRDLNPTDSPIRRPEFAPTTPPAAWLAPFKHPEPFSADPFKRPEPLKRDLFKRDQPVRQEAPSWMGSHHHDPIEDVIAPHSVIVHHNEDGVLDYWLAPRIVSGSKTLIKVMPVAQTNMGIFVHSIDEVRDYMITPSGDWLAASDPN